MARCVNPPCTMAAVCETMAGCFWADSDDPSRAPEPDQPTPQWAVLQIFGHRRHVGIVSRVERYGTVMCRLDVPREDGAPAETFFYGGSSIFCETPVTEERGRQLLARLKGTLAPARSGWRDEDELDDPEC